ncbi:MAG: SGNH/GDSL hydrolase family protein [Verrucomicrobiota bacterium]
MNLKMKQRLFHILALGILLVLCLLAYFRFSLQRPAGDGPAGPMVPARVFEKSWSEKSVLLIGFGDSVTAGFGASKNRSYFDRLVRNPDNEFPEMKGKCLSSVFPNLKATNLALSGSTSLQHVKMQSAKVKKQADDVLGIIVLTTGGNDIIHNYGKTPPHEGAMYGATFAQAKPWIDNFEIRLDEMLTTYKETFPGGCHVFLANIYDPTDGLGDADKASLPTWNEGPQILAAYNKIIERAAEKRPFVHLVNIHDEFLGHGIHSTQFWRKNYRREDPHYWYHMNLEDPNDRGYDALRRLFLIEMVKVFAPTEQK